MQTAIQLFAIWFAASIGVGFVWCVFVMRFDNREAIDSTRWIQDKRTILGLR